MQLSQADSPNQAVLNWCGRTTPPPPTLTVGPNRWFSDLGFAFWHPWIPRVCPSFLIIFYKGVTIPVFGNQSIARIVRAGGNHNSLTRPAPHRHFFIITLKPRLVFGHACTILGRAAGRDLLVAVDLLSH